MNYHIEQITCPRCKKHQLAEVKHTLPFYTYSHTCECGYEIEGDEWETTFNYKQELAKAVRSFL